MLNLFLLYLVGVAFMLLALSLYLFARGTIRLSDLLTACGFTLLSWLGLFIMLVGVCILKISDHWHNPVIWESKTKN